MDKRGYRMVSRYEQVELFSPQEYQRRLDVLRDVMRENGVNVLFFPECAEEAYDQWLTGRRMLDCMIVPERGDVTGVLYSEFDERDVPDRMLDFSRYRMQKPMEPVCGHVDFVPPMTGRELAHMIGRDKPERIGLVLPRHLTAELDAALREYLPQAERVDMSIPVATARAVKSGEELAAIRESRDMQVKIYDALGQLIRPGRRMWEIEQEIHCLVRQMGGANVAHAHLICDGPQDQPSMMHKYDDRTVESGDRFFALMEANGPGGQHICFGRSLTLGEPSADLVRIYDAATRLHKYAVSLMKPGATLGEIAVRTRKYANALGYDMRERLGWNWMHSLGGYYYEQYSLEDYTEDIPLKAGVLLHCHPVIYRLFPEIDPFVREEVFVLNAYQVTDTGAEDLIGVPFGIRVLE